MRHQGGDPALVNYNRFISTPRWNPKDPKLTSVPLRPDLPPMPAVSNEVCSLVITPPSDLPPMPAVSNEVGLTCSNPHPDPNPSPDPNPDPDPNLNAGGRSDARCGG